MFLRKRTKEDELPFAVRVTMAVTAFILGASFCITGNMWHTQPTFYYVNQLPIPWWVYGIFFLVGAFCLLIEQFRPIGFLIGAIAYSFFALTVWLAVIAASHINLLFLSNLNFPHGVFPSFFAACNLTTICVLYLSELKNSIYVQVDPERQNLLNK